MTTYTPAQKAAALAELELRHGNVNGTARALGIPQKTLEHWAKKTQAANLTTKNIDYAELWAEKERLALQRLGELVPTASFRDLAIFAGIAADKHLDHLLGRPKDKDSNSGGDTTLNVQVNYYGHTDQRAHG